MYLIAAAIVILTAFLIFRLVRQDYSRRGRLAPGTALLQCLVFVLHAFLLELAIISTDWPHLHCSGVSLSIGLFCGACGLVFLLAAVGVFRSIGRILGRRSDLLKQSGIYRWSRNPQIVGYGLFLLGFLILWPSWRIFANLVVYAVIAHRMVLVEEEHLNRKHGGEYEEYCRRTSRYIGF